MFTIINVFPIFKKHFEMLKKDATSLILVILYLFIPLGMSLILIYEKLVLSPESIKTLITAFSIFTGFIINVILIIFDIIKRSTKNRERIHEELIVHLYYNSLYELTISIFLLIFSLFSYFTYPKLNELCVTILSFILYFILMNFLITLLQITKMIFVLLNKEIQLISSSS